MNHTPFPSDDGEKQSVSSSGYTVYRYRNGALHGFSLSLYVRAGSLYETESTQGLSHFYEHVAVRAINEQLQGGLYPLLDRLGLTLNAVTGMEMIQFTVTGAEKYFETAARLLLMLFRPLSLTRAQVDLERRRIKAELREDDPKDSLAVFSANLLYPDSPLRFPVIGTFQTVNAVGIGTLEDFRRRILTPQNTFFYLTGCASDEDLDFLLRETEALPPAPPDAFPPRLCQPAKPASFGKRDGQAAVKSADYTLMRFHFDVDMTRVSQASLNLLYTLLLSGNAARLYMELSERRGLIYDVMGYLDIYRGVGCFAFDYELRGADAEEAASLTVDILRGIKRQTPAKDEIAYALYTDTAESLLDNPEGLSYTIASECHFLDAPYRDVAGRQAAYLAVTPEELRRTAEEVFRSENCLLTLKGNKKKINVAALHEILKKLDI